MKALILVVMLVLGISSYGQGTILFNNRTGPIDAPVSGPGGRGLGEYPGAVTQLFLVNLANGGVAYTPLQPTTTYRTTSPAAAYYVNAVTVTVPGMPAGSQVTVVMRSWVGPEYGTTAIFGQSDPVTVILGGLPPGGGAPLPDALLIGLVGHQIAVPETSTLALSSVGAVLLLVRRRKL